MRNNPQIPAQSNILDAALGAHARGWTPVPLKPGTKRPALGNWPEVRYADAEAVKAAFAADPTYNLGVALGAASGGLVDIDLDHPKAPYAARFFLPADTMRTGRVGSPGSHYWYRVPDLTSTIETWRTPDKRMIVEARASGHQTVLPPSIHPDGESYRWESDPWFEPRGMSQQELMARTSCIALTTYLAEVWPSRGGRHDAYLALAGSLLREGPPDAPAISPVWGANGNAEGIIRVLAGLTHDDDGPDARVEEVVPSTIRKIREGRPVQGFPTLAQHVGEDQGRLIRDFVYRAERWYGHERSTYTALEEPLRDAPAQSPEDALTDGGSAVSVSLTGSLAGVEPETLGRMIRQEVVRMHVRDLAKQAYLEETVPVPEIRLDTVETVLEQEPPHAPRVAGLIPWRGQTLVMAQRKTGKTMLCLNLAHSLITGEPFLDEFEVVPIEPHRCVVYLNFEVEASELAENLRDRGTPSDRLRVLNLRDQGNPMLTERGRAALAKAIRQVDAEAIIVDPFSNVFTGESENNATEVTQWLNELGRWTRQDCGAEDLVLVAHKGKSATAGARGSSALEGWYSSGLSLDSEDPDNPDSPRILSSRARSRGMNLEKRYLLWDSPTCTLTLGDAVNAASVGNGTLTVPVNPITTDQDARDALVAVLQAQGGQALSGTVLKNEGLQRLRDAGGKFSTRRAQDMLDALVADGEVIEQRGGGRGPGGGVRYLLASDQPPRSKAD